MWSQDYVHIFCLTAISVTRYQCIISVPFRALSCICTAVLCDTGKLVYHLFLHYSIV
uniref:Uncharacterized protein n=2 Tax=Anguilla anguilla TaxID=7936 RepID=A0A0E9SKQ1_ANGAN